MDRQYQPRFSSVDYRNKRFQETGLEIQNVAVKHLGGYGTVEEHILVRDIFDEDDWGTVRDKVFELVADLSKVKKSSNMDFKKKVYYKILLESSLSFFLRTSNWDKEKVLESWDDEYHNVMLLLCENHGHIVEFAIPKVPKVLYEFTNQGEVGL